MAAPNYTADGDINPCRFVKMDGAASTYFRVLECAAVTDTPIGISQEGSREAPGLSGASALAAAAGDTLQVHGLGDECLLELGTGGASAGDLLGPDADGKGIALTPADGGGAEKYIGAIALQPGSAGEKIRVQVHFSYTATA